MDISSFYGYFIFHSFQDVVDWLFSYVPFVLLTVFVLNAFFKCFILFYAYGG